MYLRTRTWAIISVICFLAAFYFWQLGEQRAAREQESRRAAKTNAIVPLLSSQTNAVAQVRPRTVGIIETNGPVPYRLRNTDRPLEELVRSDDAVLLRNALIDATSGVELPIPPHLRAPGETKSHVVQSRGTITEDFRAALKNAGAEVVSYVPNNAYLVRVSPEQAQALRGSPQVQSVIPWEPIFKIIDSKLLALAVEQKPLPDGNPLVVMAFPGEEEAAAAALRDLGGSVMRRQSSPFGTQLLVHTPPDKLIEVAQVDTVQAIEPAYRRVLANDLSRTRVSISTNTTTLNNHLDLTGSGTIVGLNDTGVDVNHPDLRGRVIVDATSTGVDLDGHGTHVAGTIMSSGLNDQGVVAPGSTNTADFRGMAPQASVFVQTIDIVTGPLKPDTELQEVAATNGVFISNNSWGYLGAFDYTFAAAIWDAAVRDAVPGQQGSQAQTYVFAAGNSGFGDEDGSGGFVNSISAPATAKNVITVGATEQFRNITNEIVIGGVTNVPFALMTDSDNQVVSFSSRGNVGPGIEGSFGRFKPDVVAPGTFVVSTRATNWSDNLNLQYFPGFLREEVVPVGQTNLYFFGTGPNTIEARIRVLPNNRSPIPFPTNSIYVRRGSPPPPSDIAVQANMLNISNNITGGIANDVFYVAVGNNFNQDVYFDIQVVVIDKYPPSPGDEQLVQLNQGMAPLYRFESGTSMAAPVVSGMLALMQQHLNSRGVTNPSPALMKALLINGARSIGQYNLEVDKVANHQGWGLPNITNSLPLNSPSNLDQWPVRFFDQETNALVTGQSVTREVLVSSNAQALRMTLVWTDPPGNPSVGAKLVNDLDLIVTNLTTSNVYVGNIISGDFNSRVDPTNVLTAVDVINNVENVYIPDPIAGHRYSVTVKARRVNVNAVTAHSPTGIAQDYALVISSGSPADPPTFTVGSPTVNVDPRYEVVTLTNGIPVVRSTVGANPSGWTPPNSNGLASQWRFFVFQNTNIVANTNVAFFTFIAPNMAWPRQSEQADVDLYVSTNPALTNFDAAAIATASTSRRRGGTEAVVFTNATAEYYYIGVKSEDQQAALFGLFGFAGSTPFSQKDEDGNVIVNGLGVPVAIPDGSSENATPVYVFGYCLDQIQIRNVVVTNVLSHQNGGDLFGQLEHDGRQSVLNNHRGFQGDNVTFIYDDSDSGQIVNSIPTDPPGTLRNFWGQEGQGTWQLTMVDNALSSVGRIEALSIRLEPVIDTNENFTTVLILPNRFFYTAVTVPADAIGLTIEVIPDRGPVDVYVSRNAIPDEVFYDHYAQFDTSGGTLEITPSSVPPLSAGLYFIGLRNPNSFPLLVQLRIRVQRDLRPAVTNIYHPIGTLPLLDDAVTTSLLSVTDAREIADVRVGVRIEHSRASDLVLRLVSPAGTRILLSENRGGDSTLGYGATLPDQSYVHTIFTDDTNLTTTPIKFGMPPFTNSFGPTNTGSSVITGPAVFFSGFEAAACGSRVAVGDFVDNWFVSAGDSVDVFCNGANGQADTGDKWLELNGANAGEIFRTAPTVAGAEYLLTFAYAKNPSITNAEFDVQLNFISNTNWVFSHSVSNHSAGLGWQNGAIRFTATRANTPIGLRSRTPGSLGMYVDSIQLRPLVVQTNGRNYFLPEEPLRELRGENAYGIWRLEIWDNRVGAPVNAVLRDWQVDFDFANTTTPTTVLTNGQCFTNVLEGSAVRYFRVDVPINATRATNTFFSTGNLNMGIDNTTLPTGTLADDYPPTIGSNGTRVITIANNPPLRPGRSYFVALRNVDTSQTNGFQLCVNFDATRTNDLSSVIPLTNCISSNIEGTNLISYYSFDAATNAVGLLFDLFSTNGNVDLFVRRGLPLPFPGNSLESRNRGTNSEHIAVGTGQIPGRWYIGVLNNELTSVNYTLCVSEVTNYTRLTNDVCATNTLFAFNETHYFKFTIGPTTESAEFSLTGSGDVDLYVRNNPPVSRFVYDYASASLGVSNEEVVVAFDTFPVPLAPGDWHVAVVSRESVPVSYCLKVTEFDPSGVRLYITNGWSDTPPRYMDLTIVGPDYLNYYIEYSDTLTDDPASWKPVSDSNGVPLLFGAATGAFTYRDTPLTVGDPPNLVTMRFYRVRVL